MMMQLTDFNRIFELLRHGDDPVGELLPLLVVRQDFIQPSHVRQAITPLLVFLKLNR